MTDAVLPLAGRYRFVRALKPAGPLLRWVARHNDGSEIIAAVVEPQLAGRLDTARGVKQMHLSSIVEVLRGVPATAIPPESNPRDEPLPEHFAVALAEYVPGASLTRLLSRGPLHPARAVAWTLRLCDAVRALHAKGAVHGAVSSAAVVADPLDRPVPPVLSQLVAPALGAYCSPERLRGASPSPADDVWALFVLLYTALTGKQPFEGASREELLRAVSTSKPPPLAAAGIQEPLLHETLRRGLVVERMRRVSNIDALVKCLDAWERRESVLPTTPVPPTGPAPSSLVGLVTGAALGGLRDVVFDLGSLPDDEEMLHHGSRPNAAPVPAGTVNPLPQVSIGRGETGPEPARGVAAASAPFTSPATAKTPSVNPFASKRSAGPVIAGLLVVAVAAGGVLWWTQRDEPPAPSAESDPSPLPAAPAPSEPARPQQRPLSPEEQVNACVPQYFPEETFDPDTPFDFVCDLVDLRDSAERLYEAAEVRADRAELVAASSTAPAEVARDAAPPEVVPVDATPRPKPAPEQATEHIVAGRSRRALGWYELPATAVIRRGCCPGAAPIKLPETPGWCEQLQDVLREFADDSEKVGDLAPKAKRFDKAIQCLFATGVRRPYAYKKPPDETNGTAFQRFLSHAAIVDARRGNR